MANEAAPASGWRDEILREFAPGMARLTVAADPDGLLLEAGVLEGLRGRGFEAVRFEDPIAFRFLYESRYRSCREPTPDLVVAVRGGESDVRVMPWDVLHAARRLSFSIGALFPRLSSAVVSTLDRGDFDLLYAAHARERRAQTLGVKGTREFVLRHVFGVAPETIREASDLLRFLLRRHYRRLRLPPGLERHLVRTLRQTPAFAPWPLERIVPDREAFFAFLQERWPIFLKTPAGAADAVHETTAEYELAVPGPARIPFGHGDVRVYVDNLFLEGALRPVPAPRGRVVGASWARPGVVGDPQADRARRLHGLLTALDTSLPDDTARHQDWLAFAPRWAQVNALVFDADAGKTDATQQRYERLRDRVDRAFTAWVRRRFETLHNLPPAPPVMIHQVARALARRVHERPGTKAALLVVDGLALDQWVTVRDALTQQRPALRFREESLFAWIPTLTTVSRQACFSGRPPFYFAGSIGTTDREPAAWKRFWQDEGLEPAAVVYAKNLREPSDVDAVAGRVSHPRVRVAGLVVDEVDRILHGMTLGSAGMHNLIRHWTRRGMLAALLDLLLDRGFTVFLTSDHGNVETHGCGSPKEGSVADLRAQRVRVFSDPALRARVAQEFPDAWEWPPIGLPADYLPLLAPGRRAFVRETERPVAHGGATLEEVVVPFVEIERLA